MRGPFGAPAEHFAEYTDLVLISSGIGATPFASVCKVCHGFLAASGASVACWGSRVPHATAVHADVPALTCRTSRPPVVCGHARSRVRAPRYVCSSGCVDAALSAVMCNRGRRAYTCAQVQALRAAAAAGDRASSRSTSRADASLASASPARMDRDRLSSTAPWTARLGPNEVFDFT